MKKTFLSLLLLAGAMAAAAGPVYQSETYYKVNDLFYRIISDSTVETAPMQDCIPYEGNVVVPSTVTINGQTYTVTRIGDETFAGTCQAVSLSLPSTLLEVGKEAFSQFPIPVRLPESVRRIEWGAFVGITVDELYIPANVEFIDEDAFFSAATYRIVVNPANTHFVAVDSVALCSADTSVLYLYASRNPARHYTVPSQVRRLVESSFYGSNNLDSVYLPEGLREINCIFGTRLQGLHIPASVCRIGGSLLENPPASFDLTVDPANRNYKVEDNMLLSFDGDTLLMVLGAEGDFIVPQGVKVLGDYLFYYNDRIDRVVVPDGATTIGIQTFCGSSANVVLPPTIHTINNHAFWMNTGTQRVSLPNLTTLGRGAFQESAVATVDSLNSLREIPPYAFYYSALFSLKWGDQVESIGEYAFFYTKLSAGKKEMPASLRRMGMDAFLTNNGFTRIVFRGPIDTIGQNAFRCRILQFTDTTVPVVYGSNTLSNTDTVYTPCGFAEIFEQAIPHGSNVAFAEWCSPESVAEASPADGVTLYPNPATRQFSIAGLPTGGADVEVSDCSGRIVMRRTLADSHPVVDIAALPAGIYFVTLRTPHSTTTRRLVVK